MSQLLEEMLDQGLLRPCGVVHLGAEHSQEASAYDKAGAQQVLWAEASPENWEHAETLRNLHGRPHHKMVRRAIWHEDDLELPFNIYNARSSNSLFDNDLMHTYYPRHDIIATVPVKTITVDTMMAREWEGPKCVDLLVMDLQGAELHALQGATTLLLLGQCLKTIVTEAMTEPLYKGQCLLSDLEDFLAPFGFVKRDQRRHECGLWYRDTVGVEIAAGRLPDVPQWDVLFERESA